MNTKLQDKIRAVHRLNLSPGVCFYLYRSLGSENHQRHTFLENRRKHKAEKLCPSGERIASRAWISINAVHQSTLSDSAGKSCNNNKSEEKCVRKMINQFQIRSYKLERICRSRSCCRIRAVVADVA
jgi:hypothetical protein